MVNFRFLLSVQKQSKTGFLYCEQFMSENGGIFPVEESVHIRTFCDAAARGRSLPVFRRQECLRLFA
jgi:hypothetical protein